MQKSYHFNTVSYVVYTVAFLMYPNCTHSISVYHSSLSKVSFSPRTRTPRSYLSETPCNCCFSSDNCSFSSPCHAPTWTEDFSCHHRLLLLSVRMYGETFTSFSGKWNNSYHLQPGYPCECSSYPMPTARISGS